MSRFAYQFKIGDCGIRLETLAEQEAEEQFHPFFSETACQNRIYFEAVEQLPEFTEEDLVTEQDVMYSEYLIDNEYIRTFHGIGTKTPYAVLEKTGSGQWSCSYLRSCENRFASIRSCFGHIALERILMEEGTTILHASFIEQEGKAILFTGPSGIGKSTQAELWKQYENAEILNGDRTLLRKENGIWYAYGSPYAGSSKIYKNKKVPVGAIVALQQSPEKDQCILQLPQSAFSCLYAGMTLNTWNRLFMERAVEIIYGLCMEVPVFQLQCRPQQSAVVCLKQTLKKIQEV